MKTQIVCLANSYKEGGRCLAGIEIKNGNPVFQNGKPNWIRPVCQTAHNQVPTNLVEHIKLLDIIEIDILKNVPDSYQSENVLFDTNTIKVISTLPSQNIANLCSNGQPNLFGNKGKAVTDEATNSLNHSLTLVKVQNASIYEKTYQDKENSQVRILFTFNRNQYDLPVTDPVFLSSYKSNKNLLNNVNEVFLVISLGILHEGWHYKLVAGIIY